MLATRDKLGAKRAAFRTKHIGRPHGVWKTWQFVGLVENLDPDQAASFGQLELGQPRPDQCVPAASDQRSARLRQW